MNDLLKSIENLNDISDLDNVIKVAAERRTELRRVALAKTLNTVFMTLAVVIVVAGGFMLMISPEIIPAVLPA